MRKDYTTYIIHGSVVDDPRFAPRSRKPFQPRGLPAVSCIMPPMIRVRLPQKKKELEVPGPRRVMDILAQAGVRPTTVIVTQGKKLLTKDHRVEDGETIDVISVVSGG